jgi:MFS transporter, ACS family, tartrate transporter
MRIDHRESATMVSATLSDNKQGSDPSLALSAVSERALRKNAWRLLPFLAFASFVHYMDRTNIAFAALSMNRDLGLTAAEFGTAASIFYFGYVLVSVPSSLAVYRYGARRWLACIMICWGLGAAAKALVTGPATLSTIRFIEGAAQAGFFPGVIYYLTLWFPPQYRARALAWFLVSIPASAVIGGPVAVTLLQMDGVLGLSGWRWLFLIEGLPTVVFGLIALYVIVDGPKDAGWLTGEERRELLTVIADEPPVGRQSFLVALRDKRTSGLAAVFFLLILGVLGPAYWMPLILKSHGLSDAQVGWISAGPYLVAAVAMVLSSRLMDRTGGHVLYLAGACLIAAAGFAFSVFYNALLPALLGLTIALAGLGAARPAFFSIPPKFLTGIAAAGGLALINSAGSLGGVVGPFAVGWLKDATGSFRAGLYSLAGALVLASLLTLVLGALVRGPPKSRSGPS